MNFSSETLFAVGLLNKSLIKAMPAKCVNIAEEILLQRLAMTSKMRG